MTPANVDDIVASVEDAVRRAYALGRADAMKRVVELAQSDDPSLRALALLGPAEPARPEPPPALLDAPAPAQRPPAPPQDLQPAHTQPEHHVVEAHERAADRADAEHEGQAAAAPQPAVPAAAPAQPGREMPTSVGGFLADFFYPIGSKKR